MASALTAQSAFLDNIENVVNRRVDIREDMKRYQDTLSYASSKVDYSIGESIYMIPSDMNLKIRSGTARSNNKILISNGKFILGKNEKVPWCRKHGEKHGIHGETMVSPCFPCFPCFPCYAKAW